MITISCIGLGSPLFRACFPKPCYFPRGMLDCPHRFTSCFLAFIFMVSFIVTLSHLYWCCCNDSSTRYVWVAFCVSWRIEIEIYEDNAHCVYLPLVSIVVIGRRLMNTTTSCGRLCLCSTIGHFDFFPFYSPLNHPKFDESGNCALRLTVCYQKCLSVTIIGNVCQKRTARWSRIDPQRALISGFTRNQPCGGEKAPNGRCRISHPQYRRDAQSNWNIDRSHRVDGCFETFFRFFLGLWQIWGI